MDETVRQANSELQTENQKLQSLNTSLHKKYHTMSLKVIILIILCKCSNIIYHLKKNIYLLIIKMKMFYNFSWQVYKIM